MRYIILITFLFSINSFALDIEQDKQKHIMATFTISGAMYSMMRSNDASIGRSIAVGLVTANVIGLMKEYSDDFVDPHDIRANAIGSLLGVSFCLVWEF